MHYHIPPCQLPLEAIQDLSAGLVTEAGRLPPSNQPRVPTPPYPWPHRAPLSGTAGGQPTNPTGGTSSGSAPSGGVGLAGAAPRPTATVAPLAATPKPKAKARVKEQAAVPPHTVSEATESVI